jgi:hypothetical protein
MAITIYHEKRSLQKRIALGRIWELPRGFLSCVHLCIYVSERRLARTHSKLTVRLWIEMILPSKVIPGGIPVVSVKTLTLRRGNGHHPAAKGHKPSKKH